MTERAAGLTKNRNNNMAKNEELGLSGAGVEPLVIPSIDKKISKYQKMKDARCTASPPELAAKAELQKELHAHRDELLVNGDGERFYRSDGRDYVLEEKLKVRKVETPDEDED